ncbi:precorrin-3B synthase [Camelimonas fluminis]|uniref:Precorrin-3B synthase n=1 Tax=Camelimonas fluminis TaxID=1576911 RepID=A0ABV7UFP0_9HYPH|nr:precorrin-3B synthase [Camelimonas fluminis]GHE51884.1 precorrin-3B synthase [Camelimonas fluminis]
MTGGSRLPTDARPDDGCQNGGWRRGACPSLATPMQTGDGLLARLTPRDGDLSMAQLAALAEAAARHGNGLIEITMRGAVQIRGLTTASAEALAMDAAASGVMARQGLAVDVNALAGVDPLERCDPRPLAARIAGAVNGSALAPLLGPKVSVTVDSGGQFGLSALKADIRLLAVDASRWAMMLSLATGTRRAFRGDETAIASAALDMLAAIAALGPDARMRDVAAEIADGVCAGLVPVDPVPAQPAIIPVGIFPTVHGPAIGLTPPFGATDSVALRQLAAAFPQAPVRFAPERGLLLMGLDAAAQTRLRQIADDLGFIRRADDLRLRISVCAGAPLCASAAVATRPLAADLARDHRATLDAAVAPGQQLHVSGCGKRCGAPSRNVTPLDMPVGAAVVTGVFASHPHAERDRALTLETASAHLSQLSRVLHILGARHTRGDAPDPTPDALKNRP